MQKVVSFVICIIFSWSVKAQIGVVTTENMKGKAKDYYIDGNNAYAFGKYQLADSLLKLAIKQEKNFISAHWLLGVMNLENNRNFEGAIEHLEIVKKLNDNYNNLLLLKLGYAYFSKGDFETAKKYFNEFASINGLPPDYEKEAKNMVRNCDFAKEAIKHPVNFKPVNLGQGVNSAGDDLMPMLSADERFLYFTRMNMYNNGKMADEDIYVSKWNASAFDLATPISEMVNTLQYNEGAHCISPSNKYLFFTSCDRPDRVGGCDIYFTKRTGNDWDRPKNLWIPVNSKGWDSQPCIAADGRTLYFVSNRPGGYGGMDIYVSTIDNTGKWSEPQNLGPTINTEGNEERPFIHPDGYTLYFSSDGAEGMGKQDLFMSRKQTDGTWGKPQNFGYPINTAGDEIGIYVSTDGKSAYFASEQPDTYGGMDIYKFDMPENLKPYKTTFVKGIVRDKDNGAPLLANLKFIELSSGLVYTASSTDAKTGEYLVTLPLGKNYACQVSKDGYLFYSENFSLQNVTSTEPFYLNINLSKIQPGGTVILQNIFFGSNKYDLLEESKSELNTLIDLLQKNPTMKIEIGGHTDNTGKETDNSILSQKRAESVVQFLTEKGIAADRLTAKGYASSKPIAPNTTEEGKAKNRRTEFTVVSY